MARDSLPLKSCVFERVPRRNEVAETCADRASCFLRISIFYVTLPAVWLVLLEHIIKRGKLVVSGGVTRGRVARDVIGVTTPKDMTSQAQAQKPTRTSGRTTNPNPKVRKSGAVGKAVLAQDPGFDGAKSSFF